MDYIGYSSGKSLKIDKKNVYILVNALKDSKLQVLPIFQHHQKAFKRKFPGFLAFLEITPKT